MDPKSIVIGALAAVIILMTMGVAGRDKEIPREKDSSIKGKLSSVEQRLFQKLTAPMPGRFQVDATGQWVVILDTATGQAWKHSLATSGPELSPSKLKPAGD